MKIENAMKIVTAEEMRAIDRVTSERFGVPLLTLMENAGSAVAEYAMHRYATAEKIAVLCGKGNNGGDGFVAARALHEKGKTVQVVLLADPADLRDDAAAMFGRLPVETIVVKSSDDLKRARPRIFVDTDLFLDAILGTGFKPPVSGLVCRGNRDAERQSGAGDCCRHSLRRRCGCGGGAGGARCARRCHCDFYRGASSARFQCAYEMGRRLLRRSVRRRRRLFPRSSSMSSLRTTSLR